MNKIKHKITNTHNNNYDLSTPNNNITHQNKFFLSLPSTNERFFKISSSVLKGYHITLVPKIKKSMKEAIKLGKDTTYKLKKTGFIYELSCKNCSAMYIGETKKSLEERMYNLKNKTKLRSAVFQYKIHYGHEFNYDELKF